MSTRSKYKRTTGKIVNPGPEGRLLIRQFIQYLAYTIAASAPGKVAKFAQIAKMITDGKGNHMSHGNVNNYASRASAAGYIRKNWDMLMFTIVKHRDNFADYLASQDEQYRVKINIDSHVAASIHIDLVISNKVDIDALITYTDRFESKTVAQVPVEVPVVTPEVVDTPVSPARKIESFTTQGGEEVSYFIEDGMFNLVANIERVFNEEFIPIMQKHSITKDSLFIYLRDSDR